MSSFKKRKILNDPVYGFVSIPSEFLFELVEHPYFQRLRRIQQLGLTHLVYPGALHTRFQHAIGAMHLMQQAVDVLRLKGHEITEEEKEGALAAILLHDIGHGPFSHALEHTLITDTDHEEISRWFIRALNEELDQKLTLARNIFENNYPKKFLHQLVASQLDVDRLDYLKRDSFFSGVSEGVISSDRIIKMMDIHNDELVVEAKGIYSVEKFLVARRLMYWQVYMHKTVLAAEYLLMKILRRAKDLAMSGHKLKASPWFKRIAENQFIKEGLNSHSSLIDDFAKMDDYDILSSIKIWCDDSDPILARLSKNLINRKLPKTEMMNQPFDRNYVYDLKKQAMKHYNLNEEEAGYFVFTHKTHNYTYDSLREKIKIKYKDNSVVDLMEASGQFGENMFSGIESKYFLCYPKKLSD
ncbi:MAG: HD domain-containing protein [Bacteroidales bacterium]|nr:HD domain-containing protein [Bacteroidales bacterium]MCF8336611.1 HD domain-containing protein [Bacteroidales bacterium]